MIEFKLRPEDVVALNREIEEFPKLIPRVMKRAINRTTRHVRSQMVKRAARAMKIKQKILKSRAWQTKAKKHMFGRVRAGAVGWPLILLKPRLTRKGVSVRLEGKRQVLERGFIATMPSGHEGVYERVGRPRLPIREMRTRSLTDVIRAQGLEPEIRRLADERLQKELREGADYLVSRERKRRERVRTEG